MEWLFAPQKDGTTFVSITEAGFTGAGDELVKQVTDSTQGFSLVLAGLKALLEHNPYPTDLEVRQAISGNLCRCTGYVNIVKAIQNAGLKLGAVAPNGQPAEVR